MKPITIAAVSAAMLVASAIGQDPGRKPAKKPADQPAAGAQAAPDDFKREGDGDKRRRKDQLEGKAPPSLQLSSWMNTKDGKPLVLEDLKGKVIALKFWGVW